ncbi:MAG: SCP2 sterol-binding domain-containing protein [Actinomycetota bacterium]|nr:SCP2 sterol-binding domain-containing protein [Actinomycetota bacterium]
MPKYPFLSSDWVAAAKKIREDSDMGGTPISLPVRMNQIITEVPFGDGRVEAHMDTSSGGLELDLGHLEAPDLTVTLDYETAKAILVEGNPQAGMQAFLAGRIKVDGDMAKLMALQSLTPDESATAVAEKIRDITD